MGRHRAQSPDDDETATFQAARYPSPEDTQTFRLPPDTPPATPPRPAPEPFRFPAAEPPPVFPQAHPFQPPAAPPTPAFPSPAAPPPHAPAFQSPATPPSQAPAFQAPAMPPPAAFQEPAAPPPHTAPLPPDTAPPLDRSHGSGFPLPRPDSGPPTRFTAAGQQPLPVRHPVPEAPQAMPGADPSATTILPAIPPANPAPGAAAGPIAPPMSSDDRTALLPKVLSPRPHPAGTAQPIPKVVSGRAVATDETAMFGKILPRPEKSEPIVEQPRDRWSGEPLPPPVKAIKAGDGYRSIHSEFTRTTVGSVVRGTLRGAGELLITFGLVILLFAAYEVWGKTAIVDAHQSQLAQELDRAWGLQEPTVAPSIAPSGAPTPAPSATPGPNPASVMAKLYIPRLKKSWVVVQGVSQADIRYAPGHYPKSAMPGENGNFAIAGHRNRATFWDLDLLQSGDELIVESKTTWFIYKVTASKVVLPTAVEVVSPVPPGQAPGKLITLTTCNPKFDNYQRLIIHGALEDTMPRSAGKPASLGG